MAHSDQIEQLLRDPAWVHLATLFGGRRDIELAECTTCEAEELVGHQTAYRIFGEVLSLPHHEVERLREIERRKDGDA